MPLGDEAHVPGETWNLEHLATVLTLASELITEQVLHHVVSTLSSWKPV